MIRTEECIGCQACVAFCAQKAISFVYNEWGEGRAVVDPERCNGCGLCDARCPAHTIGFHDAQPTVLAAFSKGNRHTGSSGGVFFELASRFIGDGGVVFGAAFDDDLKLVHQKCTSVQELPRLCKSKYLHSDMTGVYTEIADCLASGKQVMFVGTPCQVSAVKNLFGKRYANRLLLIDFLCHGTGTQKVFDLCRQHEERRQKGNMTDFVFRAKSKRAEHSFRYTLRRDGKDQAVAGYSFEFPYYYSYLKYTIFNDSCYTCKYATAKRVGDITLGDFWGIQNYDKTMHDQKGVSMLSVNTEVGRAYLDRIRPQCVMREHPIGNASAKNQALRENVSADKYATKQKLAAVLREQGEEALVEQLSCPNIKKHIVYAKTPMFIKKAWNRVRGIK